jgi:hypothetical protein
MRYLLLIHVDPSHLPSPDTDAGQAMYAEYRGFTGWLQESGMFLGGEALQDVANTTSVSIRDGQRIVTDGPFAETKEHLAGYYLIEASDLDAAIDVALRIPDARLGTVEVRPIQEFG